MNEQPYHRYVFDTERRVFIGEFEAMYQAETVEGFDSWHQSNVDTPRHAASLALLRPLEQWRSILDVGCGKGAFTALLKTPTNRVVGVDVSPTAIARARRDHLEIEFACATVEDAVRTGRYDLVTACEVLSYVERWPEVLATLPEITDALFVSVYVPHEPIGYVKSADDLLDALPPGWGVTERRIALPTGVTVLVLARRLPTSPP